MTVHITYHGLDRLTLRTNLTPDHIAWAITDGTPLVAMPDKLQAYLINKPNYSQANLYRYYLGLVLVYRPNTFKDTKATAPWTFITALTPPAYTLDALERT